MTTPSSHCDDTARNAAQEPDMPSVLLVDDNEVARDALRAALAPHFAVTESASVATALRSLRVNQFAAVVCDLCLDGDARPLHDELVDLRIPVVLVSGRDPEQLPAEAASRGWSYLAKPCDPDALVSMVRAVMARGARVSRVTPMPHNAPAIDPSASDRPTPVLAREEPASVPPVSSIGHLGHPAPHRRADWHSSAKDSVIGLCITALALYGQKTGHPVDWYVIAILGALGVGTEALKSAVQKRPAAVGAGVAGLVGIAVLGDATDTSVLGAVSSLGVAALPAVDRIVERIQVS